jgi:aspartate/methionine/tyrosine aminotransferase
MFRINDLHGATFAHPAELLSVIALKKLPMIASHMKSMLEKNRRLLHDFLLQRDDLDYFWPEYGTIVFPRLKNGDVDPFCNALRNGFETAVVPCRFFESLDRFRVGVGIPTDAVGESLQALGRGLSSYRASLQIRA